jgi:hypothetical protein
MISLSQFSGGQKPPKALFNATSSAGALASATLIADATAGGTILKYSGSLTADVLSNVLSVTGAGMIPMFFLLSVDATVRKHRLKITVDGTVVYDFTTANVNAANRGLIAIGYQTVTNTSIMSDPVYFNNSLLIEYASSLTENNGTRFGYIYRTY